MSERRARAAFDDAFEAWRRYCRRAEVSEASSSTPYLENEHFERIVELGRPAVPHILAKLRLVPDAHFLAFALQRIARVSLPEDDPPRSPRGSGPLGNQGLAELWAAWWRERLSPEELALSRAPGGRE